MIGNLRKKGKLQDFCVRFLVCFVSFYSKLKKEEEERQAEWASKYRDRVSLL